MDIEQLARVVNRIGAHVDSQAHQFTMQRKKWAAALNDLEARVSALEKALEDREVPGADEAAR